MKLQRIFSNQLYSKNFLFLYIVQVETSESRIQFRVKENKVFVDDLWTLPGRCHVPLLLRSPVMHRTRNKCQTRTSFISSFSLFLNLSLEVFVRLTFHGPGPLRFFVNNWDLDRVPRCPCVIQINSGTKCV